MSLRRRSSVAFGNTGCLPRAVLCLAIGLGAVACSQQDAEDRLSPSGSSQVERAWIERAREAHRAADEAKSAPQRERAVEALRDAYQALPSSAPGSDWVRLDLGARLAELELEGGNAQAALEWVRRVLPVQPEPSVPAANLLVAAGRAHELLGEKEQAVTSYHRALVMNQDLMERSLEGR